MRVIEQIPEMVPIGAVHPSPENVNEGDVGAISESIEHNGFYGYVLAQRSSGAIIAGEHRWRAAQALGAAEVPVLWADVDDATARRIRLADNRTTRLGHNNAQELADLLAEIQTETGTLEGTGYDAEALDELLADLAAMQPQEELAGDPDAVPEVPAEPVTKRGDIVLCGRHRIMCGDATSFEDVEALLDGVVPDMVWTDPPYGVSIVSVKGGLGGSDGAAKPFGSVRSQTGQPFGGKARGSVGRGKICPVGIYEEVIGDGSTQTAVDAYTLCAASFPGAVLIFWGANYYAPSLPPSPTWICWDKRDEMPSNNFADCELAWVNDKGPARVFRHLWNGMIKASEKGERRVHPTQKPVALAEWCFTTYGAEGDMVLDLFGGSGTALIAAERTKRTAYIMELSESYVDVMVDRWERATGRKAQRHERITAGA